MQTGELIAGRQQAPEVYQFTGDFIIGSKEEIKNTEKLIHGEHIRYWLIRQTGMRITSEFDVLKHKVMALENEGKAA